MGLSKAQLFNDEQIKMAEIAKALSHPARIAILEYVIKHNQCICGDLMDEIPLAQPTISQHLKELKNAGLIVGDIQGPRVCYCLNKEMWKKAGDVLSALFGKPLTKNCC